eukprot:scaffold422354_cov59-Attheya_sp.AAC.3
MTLLCPGRNQLIGAPLLLIILSVFLVGRLPFVLSRRYHQSHTSTSCGRRVNVAAAFTSCAPPRFDVFAEKIVQRWQVDCEGVVHTVDEVMRSCGGAVQGVREVPLLASQQGEDIVDCGPYLNRANDGFVYFDCGSYSSGPVGTSSPDRPERFLASLSFPSSNSRVVLSIDLTTGGGVIDHCQFLRLHRAPFSGELNLQQSDCLVTRLDMPSDNFVLEKYTQCRMSSPGEPWMLQRVKWERLLAKNESGDPDEASSHNSPDKTLGWVLILRPDGLEKQDWPGLELSPNDGFAISVGAVCPVSHDVRAVLRSYNKDGILTRVVLQEGRIQRPS